MMIDHRDQHRPARGFGRSRASRRVHHPERRPRLFEMTHAEADGVTHRQSSWAPRGVEFGRTAGPYQAGCLRIFRKLDLPMPG